MVWFTNIHNDRTVYLPRAYSASPSQEKTQILKYTLNLLFKGPHPDFPELSSEVPAGTKLLDVVENPADGSITINLSKEFAAGSGPSSFEARLEQVRRTVWGVVGTQPVYLNVEGQRLEASGDGLEVRQPINASAGSDSGSDRHAAPPN